jgi:hypothetical protein
LAAEWQAPASHLGNTRPTDEKPAIEKSFRESRTQFGLARDRELGQAEKSGASGYDFRKAQDVKVKVR